MKRSFGSVWCLAGALLLTVGLACAQGARPVAAPVPQPDPSALDEQALAEFYRQRTLKIVVGSRPGGNYDLIARIVARHIGKYIPGNPTVIVDNKDGAGGIIAANLVYNLEPKDGTVIASHHEGLILQQAFGRKEIQADFRKVNWLGSTSKTDAACMVRTDLGVDLQDTIQGHQLTLGATGPGSDLSDVPRLLNATIGTNFKLVMGYGGLSQVMQAIEAKEVDGVCSGVESLVSVGGALTEGPNPIARVIVVMGPPNPGHPLLAGAPSALQMATTDEAKALIRLRQGTLQIARPLSVAPEVPSARVEALRRALAQTYADPEFRAEMERTKQDLTPSTAQEVTQTVHELLGVSPAMAEKLQTILDIK